MTDFDREILDTRINWGNLPEKIMKNSAGMLLAQSKNVRNL